MKRLKIRQIVFTVLALLCMAVIFCFSADNSEESNEKSNFFVEQLLEWIPSGVRENLSYIVRKTAHFTIYAVLGFLVSGIFIPRKIFYTLSVCFLYACTDEIHQYFVPGRACRFQDVIIDTSGALFGALIFALIFRIFSGNKGSA